MYAVIGRRHGKILSGDLTQGSGNFAVTCLLPVIESFNFAQEMRKQTSGLACPQLMFSHWEVSTYCTVEPGRYRLSIPFKLMFWAFLVMYTYRGSTSNGI